MKPTGPSVIKGKIDLVTVRELSSGIYFGKPREFSENEGYDTMRYRREEVDFGRVAKHAATGPVIAMLDIAYSYYAKEGLTDAIRCLKPVMDKVRANFCDHFEPTHGNRVDAADSADALRQSAEDLFKF